ncbi:hypothetical protein CRUP_015707 [Coryphaenoides rupestris]|nr:hypothetical protein CRUP_015707 [Coryphaenoides rupestris]
MSPSSCCSATNTPTLTYPVPQSITQGGNCADMPASAGAGRREKIETHSHSSSSSSSTTAPPLTSNRRAAAAAAAGMMELRRRGAGVSERACAARIRLFARLDARRCMSDIEPHVFPADCGPQHGKAHLHHPHVIKHTQAYFNGCKTELLYHLLCRCILPVEAGGMGVEAVFVDTDYSLDMLRLVTILENRLAAGLSTSRPPESSGECSEEAALRSCLSRLLVVHCGSSSQLLLTLHYLETSLSSRPSLSLLLIDSISAFYWLDRCAGGESMARQEDKLTKCSELLARLLRDYRVTVFATSHAIRRNYKNVASSSSSSLSSSPCSQYEQPYLCRPWQRLVTHRLLCSRGTAGANMAAAACTEKQGRRQTFTVHCTSSSSSSSTTSASSSSTASFSASCSRGTKAHKSSSFYVTDGGVVFV